MSLACPEDAAAWGAKNRVILYPDQRQTWVLATVFEPKTPLSKLEPPDDADIRRMARAVMARWFSDAPITDLGSRSGAADDIEVGQATSVLPSLSSMVQTWKQLDPLPLLRSGRLVYVPVSFSWRSRETSRPWPTRRVSWGGFVAGPCQVDADWVLIAVGDVEQAPPEKTPTERAKEVAKEIGSAVAMPLIGVGLAAIGVTVLMQSLRR